MARSTVAVLDLMPAPSQQVIAGTFGARFDTVFVQDDSAEAKRIAARGATALLTMWGSVDADTFAAGAPTVRVVQKLGVGTDKIDVGAAEANGVVVLKAAGINAEAVAELTVLLILAVSRHLPKAMAAARNGEVAKEWLRAESYQLLGKTVGLLGLGHIGQQVARRLAPFGVSIAYHDLQRADPEFERSCGARYITLDELIERSDVISLHLPSTPSTVKIIDSAVLRRVKPGLILVNTARGSLIDEAALVSAIADGRVLGAGLDVTEEEPLPATSPLLTLDRVVLTPHIGGAVANNFPRVIERAYRNVVAVLEGGEVYPGDIVTWPSADPPRPGPGVAFASGERL